MKKFEYFQMDVFQMDVANIVSSKDLNRMGNEGWELASVVVSCYNSHKYTYIFKREICEN